MGRYLIGAALGALISGAAAADTFGVGDLGEMPSRRICMETAAKVLDTYIKEYGGDSTSGDLTDSAAWVMYGWNLRPGEIDVVITCPVVADQVNAFYTVHSVGEGTEADTDAAVKLLRELWEQMY